MPPAASSELWEGVWEATLVADQHPGDPEPELWPEGRAAGGWAGVKPVRAEGPGCWEEADSGQNRIS